jgi:hypothetical protein
MLTNRRAVTVEVVYLLINAVDTRNSLLPTFQQAYFAYHLVVTPQDARECLVPNFKKTKVLQDGCGDLIIECQVGVC